MLYCVRMTVNPFYRNQTLVNKRYDCYWSRNRYAVLQFYKCTKNRYFPYNKTSYYYTDMEYIEIADEDIADDIRNEYPNNMVKIYSTNDMSIDVVISSRMYFNLVSGRRIADDAESSCIESIVHYLMELLPYGRFIKNELYNEMISNLISIRFATECQVDPIKFALLDASSWIHYYVI